jgi:hypothetical protein
VLFRSLSPKTAFEMLAKAQEMAHAMRGRSAALDQQLDELVEASVVEGPPRYGLVWLGRLERALTAAGG